MKTATQVVAYEDPGRVTENLWIDGPDYSRHRPIDTLLRGTTQGKPQLMLIRPLGRPGVILNQYTEANAIPADVMRGPDDLASNVLIVGTNALRLAAYEDQWVAVVVERINYKPSNSKRKARSFAKLCAPTADQLAEANTWPG